MRIARCTGRSKTTAHRPGLRKLSKDSEWAKKDLTRVTLSMEPQVKVEELMATLEVASCRG
jgi:hypothetical protein